MQLLPEFKQVLTREGWIELGEYYEKLKKTSYDILIYDKGWVYDSPNSFSKTYYGGTLTEIITDLSRVILKNNTILGDKRLDQIQIGDRLLKAFSFQTVNKVNEVEWEGNVYCLTFENSVLLPIKFEQDYILIPI